MHLYDKENEGSLDVDVGFIEIPNEKNYMMPSKIKSMTTSVMCTVQDLSLELHFFGGNDFGECFAASFLGNSSLNQRNYLFVSKLELIKLLFF